MLASPTSVSVVIATYNRPDHVQTCLAHLARQTVEPVETVVVDSSPDDRTAEVVREFASVTHLRNERGLGHTATSRALGIAVTTGDVVAFVDDDAYAEPEWLAELLRRYGDERVGAVGGRARNGLPGEETEGLEEVGLLLPDGRLTGNFAAITPGDVDVDHLLGANMSVRRAVVDELGGIHDHFPGTCLREETDIVLRMRRAGYRIVYTPDAVVRHVGGTYAKGHRFDLRYQYFGSRNHLVLLTHTLGFRDPHLRRYLWLAVGAIGDDLGQVVRAWTSRSDATPRTRLRTAAGGAARAAVQAAGMVVGLGASAGIALDPRHRRTGRTAG